MYNISITAVEKSIQTLAKKLKSQGFEVIVNVFKSGNGGDYYYGSTSYVELRIDGNGIEHGFHRQFMANGYDTYGSWDIMTTKGMKVAKKEFMTDLNKEINQ